MTEKPIDLDAMRPANWYRQALDEIEQLRKERDGLREALNDCEAKASLGAKMVDREHPKIADGFIIVGHAHTTPSLHKEDKSK